MPGILLSGPAGASKSALAIKLLAENPELAIAVDFQSLYRAIALVERDPSGRYPLRDERLLPLVEYLRRVLLSQGLERGFDVVATNSDGDPDRRSFLLGQLGAGAVERIVDPGIEVVQARLSDPLTGVLSDECGEAVARWYGKTGK